MCICISRQEPFRARWVPEELRPRSGRFHVFTHHTRLNVAESRHVMAPDAAWVTILRDPVTQFESAYDYYGLQYAWNLSLAEFIALPLREKRLLPRAVYGYGHCRVSDPGSGSLSSCTYQAELVTGSSVHIWRCGEPLAHACANI